MLNRSNQRINYFGYLFRSPFRPENEPYFFAYGRTAIKAGIRSLQITAGKEILAPEYICDSALDPLYELGLKVKFYPVSNDLSPDWQVLTTLTGSQTAAVFMVHYFGIPQDIDRFRKFSKDHNLLLIEDNSHGFGGSFGKKLLGTFGDIGISSPRKSLPILNGGALYLQGRPFVSIPLAGLEPVNIIKLILRDLVGRMLDLFPAGKEFFLKRSDSQADYNPKVQDWNIDVASHRLIARYNFETIRTQRTNLYRQWEKWSRSAGLRTVFSDIPGGIAPLCLPLLFDTSKDRDTWLTAFKKNQIAAYTWPALPKELEAGSNSGKNLKDHILCMPIHLSMDTDSLERTLEKISRDIGQ